MSDLTAERLRELLNYDQATGVFTWAQNVMCGHRRQQVKFAAGTLAGSVNKCGYVMIGIGGREYRAHRLAWLHVKGEWPASLIDHENEQKADNRWRNLRMADKSVNSLNRSKPSAHGTSGYLGVSYHPFSGLWHASVKVNGKKHSLKYHKTPEMAHRAYLEGKQRLCPHV